MFKNYNFHWMNLVTTYLTMCATYYVCLYFGAGQTVATILAWVAGVFFCPAWVTPKVKEPKSE